MAKRIRAVGYGSLMSARGLGRNLPGVVDCWPVHLDTARCFAKPSQRGGCLAMDVDLAGPALSGRPSSEAPPRSGCEGLLLEVRREESPSLARREGYTHGCWARLLDAAGERSLSEFLLELADGADDLLSYRQALHEVAGPSELPDSHYLPHPVRLEGEAPALIFVAPAVGASGIPGVDSAKARHPNLGRWSLANVFGVSAEVYPVDPAVQTRYAELCLLAAAHGLWVGDLLGEGLSEAHPVAAVLRRWARDRSELEAEREALRAAVPGLASDYGGRFTGSLEAALERSGLAPYFLG